MFLKLISLKIDWASAYNHSNFTFPLDRVKIVDETSQYKHDLQKLDWSL